MVDAAGRIALANAQALRMFGYTHAELLGQSVEMLVPPGAREALTLLREQFVAAPENRPIGFGAPSQRAAQGRLAVRRRDRFEPRSGS